jgi:hypothetical protein
MLPPHAARCTLPLNLPPPAVPAAPACFPHTLHRAASRCITLHHTAALLLSSGAVLACPAAMPCRHACPAAMPCCHALLTCLPAALLPCCPAASRCPAVTRCIMLHHAASRCITRRRAASRCIALHHTAALLLCSGAVLTSISLAIPMVMREPLEPPAPPTRRPDLHLSPPPRCPARRPDLHLLDGVLRLLPRRLR